MADMLIALVASTLGLHFDAFATAVADGHHDVPTPAATTGTMAQTPATDGKIP
jgi:hypothetical protein